MSEKNVEVVEAKTEVVVEETKEGLVAKAKKIPFKKIGKGVAVGALALVGMGIGYALGSKKSSVDEDDTDDNVYYYQSSDSDDKTE